MDKQELNNYLVTIPMTLGAIISFLAMMFALIVIIVDLISGIDIKAFHYVVAAFLFGGLLIAISFFTNFVQYVIENKGLR